MLLEGIDLLAMREGLPGYRKGQWVGSADCARCWLAVLVAYSKVIVFACT